MPDSNDQNKDRAKTFEELAPDPDKVQGPKGSRVMVLGAIFVAILTFTISLFSLLFAPQSTGTPTRFATATDRVLSVYMTETPTPVK